MCPEASDILKVVDGSLSLSSCCSLCLSMPICSEVFFDDRKKKCVLTTVLALNNLIQSLGFIHLSTTFSSEDNWIGYENSYYLSEFTDKTWIEAQIACRGNGSKLVEIETTDEYDFVKELAQDMNTTAVHIGGTDALSDGTMIWWSSLQPVNLTAWAPGFSNNFYTTGDDCLLLEQFNDYKVNTGDCNSRLSYICERDLS